MRAVALIIVIMQTQDVSIQLEASPVNVTQDSVAQEQHAGVMISAFYYHTEGKSSAKAKLYRMVFVSE